MGAAKVLLQGFVNRFLPQGFLDDRDDAKPVRLKRYGELNVSEFDNSLYGYCEEGSLFVAATATPGTGLTWPNSGNGVQSFLDTAPQIYIFNNEPAGTGKSIYMGWIRTIVTSAMTATTSAQFACILDNAARALTTDNTVVLVPNSPNGNLGAGTFSNVIIKAQNTATPSVAAASSAANRRVARGWFSTILPIVGDEFTAVFGRGNVGGHAGLTATAVTVRKVVDNCAPVIIPPQGSLAVHIWFPAGTTASIVPELEIVGWLR